MNYGELNNKSWFEIICQYKDHYPHGRHSGRVPGNPCSACYSTNVLPVPWSELGVDGVEQ